MLGIILAAGLAAVPLAGPTPAYPTPDPSDTQCFRGALYCPPPVYSQWGQSPPCQYILGRWVTPFGRDCAGGAA